jgi:nucleoside-diphosphate-sugar epimerase
MVTHHKNETQIKDMFHINVQGTKNVSILAELNKKLNNACCVIYISTSGVISCQTECLTEDAKYSETTATFPYYKSKIEAEREIIRSAKTNNYDLIIFRPSMIFGTQQTNKIVNILTSINSSNIKKDLFYKIKHKQMSFCVDTMINAIHVDELLNCLNNVSINKDKDIKDKIQIYNLTGHNYKMIDIFKFYDNSQYIMIPKWNIQMLINITNKLNVCPSLYYYLRMCLYDWSLDTEKAKQCLQFNTNNLFNQNNKNYIQLPLVGKMLYE